MYGIVAMYLIVERIGSPEPGDNMPQAVAFTVRDISIVGKRFCAMLACWLIESIIIGKVTGYEIGKIRCFLGGHV
jgi:hypothetical protein